MKTFTVLQLADAEDDIDVYGSDISDPAFTPEENNETKNQSA